MGAVASSGDVGEYADISLEKGSAPTGAVLKGMDRPDFGKAEEAEAWAWLKEHGLDTYAIFDDLDVCLWVPRFKVVSVRLDELGKGTHFYF